MNGKRFVFGITGIVVTLLLVLEVLIWFWPLKKYMNEGYVYWQQQKEYTMTDHGKREILLLGDSRMKDDWNPLMFYPDTYNLALAGSSPIEMYYTLKRYLMHNPKPKAVIIGFAPIHYSNMEGYTGSALFFHWLENDELEETIDILSQMEYKDYTSESRKYLWRMPNIYMSSIVAVFRGKRKYDYEGIYAKLEKNAGHMYISGSMDGKNVIPEETKIKHFVPLKVETYYMSAMISLCRERGIKVFIEQLPMGEYGYKKIINSGYIAEYEMYMEQFKDGDQVIVNSIIPVFESKYFADGSHLNEEGSKIFTLQMREKYKNILE